MAKDLSRSEITILQKKSSFPYYDYYLIIKNITAEAIFFEYITSTINLSLTFIKFI